VVAYTHTWFWSRGWTVVLVKGLGRSQGAGCWHGSLEYWSCCGMLPGNNDEIGRCGSTVVAAAAIHVAVTDGEDVN